MTTEAKFMAGIAIVTILIIVIGAFLFSKPQQEPRGREEDQNVLLEGAKNYKGNPDSPVKIIEFADFQCPACKTAHQIVKEVLAEKGENIYLVYRHFPLPTHDNAQIAAQVSQSAANQGKFWEMSDLLFQNQDNWANSNNPREIFTQYARELNLDVEKFQSDIEGSIAAVNSDYSLGNKSGVNSTPTFFINGQKYPGVIQKTQLIKIIEDLSPET